MKRKTAIFLCLFVALNLIATACAGLIGAEDEPVSGDYGPQYSTQEHQTRTFEALWTDYTENYIYFDEAVTDWDSIHKDYSTRINKGLTDEEFIDLMNALAGDLPQGSLTYQSRTERIETDTIDTSTYEGIGAFVGFQAEATPHLVILEVIAGSPAEKAGIKAHDSIFEIDGKPILLDEGLNVVERVRGPAGSSVILQVKTPGKPVRDIKVTRANLTSIGKIESHQIPGSTYGYILFPPITYEGLLEDVLGSMLTFTTNQEMKGLILDLRVAGSASGWPLQELLSLYHNGNVGEFYTSANKRQTVSVQGQDLYASQSVPLVILVGPHTSGSPEILAASLQANKRAIVVGGTTPGAVESTSSFYLPDGSRILIETASFRLPNGEELGNSGVKPDVAVQAGWDEVLPNDDPVLLSALEILGLIK